MAAGGAGQLGVAVRLAPRPVFLAGREELLTRLDASLAEVTPHAAGEPVGA